MMTHDGAVVRPIDLSTAMRPYPTYRDSGVNRLGRVPEHWEVRRLKHSLGINAAVLPEDTEPDYEFRYIDIGSVGTGELISDPRPLRFATAPSRARRVVGRGDTLVSTVRTYLKAVWHADKDIRDVVASTGFAVLTPRPWILPKYVGYVCRSVPFTDHVTAESVGVVYPAIAEARLASALRLCIPPLPEQHAIVRILDHADWRIRRYIRAKEELIKLLDEQKRAIIHQAVTGQLDVRSGQPYPIYKASGLEWLREIPELWERRPSKRTFTPRKELARPDDIQLSATQAFGVIAQKDYEGRIGRKIVKIFKHLEKRRHVEVDDFVISMRSFQGGLERAWTSGCIRSSYVVLQSATSLSVDYFGYLFKSVGYIRALQSTANFIRDGQDLNFGDFCRVDLPFPPIQTQRRIAKFLDNITADIATTVDRYRRQIDLLQEYRTRLIADVVTGKLDVRQAAASLPELDPLSTDESRSEPEPSLAAYQEAEQPALPQLHR